VFGGGSRTFFRRVIEQSLMLHDPGQGTQLHFEKPLSIFRSLSHKNYTKNYLLQPFTASIELSKNSQNDESDRDADKDPALHSTVLIWSRAEPCSAIT
jgi:hypothetical protein